MNGVLTNNCWKKLLETPNNKSQGRMRFPVILQGHKKCTQLDLVLSRFLKNYRRNICSKHYSSVLIYLQEGKNLV